MVRTVTQLELENFAQGIQSDDTEGGVLLSVADVKAKEILFINTLRAGGKINEGEEVPSWAEMYQRLLNSNVPDKFAAYIAWATMPKKYRWPETLEQFATDCLGLTSARSVFTWRKKYPEIDMMVTQLQAEAMLEYRPDAFHALGTVASDPSYRANPDRRLFFEMTGDHTPRVKNVIDDGHGVGRKVLGELKKKSTAHLLEILGPDALEMVQEMERELNQQDEEESDGSE